MSSSTIKSEGMEPTNSLQESRGNSTGPYASLGNIPGVIRLIKLFPLEDEDHMSEVRCELEVASLSDKPLPRYDALSYVWGDEKDGRKPIQLNGSVFEVTLNLFVALVFIRNNSNGVVTLWIDALCINQKDTAERSSQVQQMRRIYSSAFRVRVWLGYIGEVAGAEPLLVRLEGLRHQKRITIQSALSVEPDLFDDEKPWYSLASILLSPWFLRVWTLQEVAVGKNAILMAGTFQMPWEYLEYVAMTVADLWNSVLAAAGREEWDLNSPLQLPSGLVLSSKQSIPLKVMDDIMPKSLVSIRRKAFHGWPLTMLELLSAARFRQASDARDRLFALVGLCTTSETDFLQPNYSKTAQEVFEEFTRGLIHTATNLDVLVLAGLTVNKLEGLPSWCPDYSHAIEIAGDDQESFWFLDRSDSDNWSAGGSSHGPLSNVSRPGSSDRTVCLKGIIIDRIAVPNPGHQEIEMKKFLETRNIAIDEGKIKCQHGDQSDLIATAKYMGVSYGLADFGKAEGRVITSMSNDPDFQPKHFITYNTPSGTRPLLISEGDHFIAASLQAREGDYLCVLLGGRSAFLLRPVMRKVDEWQLVGPCFATGIMNGEILQEVEEGKRQVQEFHIV